jgi:hypothetical protein
MHVNYERQGGLWVRPEGIETPFVPPDPKDVQGELTDVQRYAMGVAVNEVVKVAYRTSLINSPDEAILSDPRAITTYVSDKKEIIDPRLEGVDLRGFKLPISATVSGLTMYGADAQKKIEGYPGIRIDFEDENGVVRKVRATTRWAMLDDEPLDPATYESLMGKIVMDTLEDDEDLAYELLDVTFGFARANGGNDWLGTGIVLDTDTATEVSAEAFIESLINPKNYPDKLAQLRITSKRGVTDPRAYYEDYGTDERQVEGSDSTVTEYLFVLPNTLVGLRRPLNGTKSDFNFVPKGDDQLLGTVRLLSDLYETQKITNIMGNGPEPMIIDRRGPGIGIDYKLAKSLRTKVTFEGTMPYSVISPEEATSKGLLPKNIRV